MVSQAAQIQAFHDEFKDTPWCVDYLGIDESRPVLAWEVSRTCRRGATEGSFGIRFEISTLIIDETRDGVEVSLPRQVHRSLDASWAKRDPEVVDDDRLQS
jgi:hypothetical protein